MELHGGQYEVPFIGRPVEGEVALPGSKSITQRALCLAALAEGESRIEGPLLSDDTLFMVAGLKNLGFQVRKKEVQDFVTLTGAAGSIPWDQGRIWAGGAGTVLRFILPVLPLGKGTYLIDGDDRLRRRPVGALVEALRKLGADIEHRGAPGDNLPLEVRGRGGLQGGPLALSGAVSSQFLSALLMIGPLLEGGLEIRLEDDLTSKPYVDLTLQAMDRFGVQVEREGYSLFRVPQGAYRGCTFPVEGDASAATYFLAAGAVSGGAVRVNGVGAVSRQGDSAFLSLLEAMGARTAKGETWMEAKGPVSKGGNFDMNGMPDAVPTLAMVGLFAPSPTEIRKVPNLRVKESDRIAAVASELTKLGARVETFDDGLRVTPGTRRGAILHTHEDHRMAMTFAVAGLAIPGVVLENPGCVSKSFPDFFERLEALAGEKGKRRR
ncbi:MAG: 3-phosphoshikimate 1-carboxyvinyltransferase [Planctomycetota bacterium]|jgi:3-phosphoshikimate 1-carboxyvinyltransferase